MKLDEIVTLIKYVATKEYVAVMLLGILVGAAGFVSFGEDLLRILIKEDFTGIYDSKAIVFKDSVFGVQEGEHDGGERVVFFKDKDAFLSLDTDIEGTVQFVTLHGQKHHALVHCVFEEGRISSYHIYNKNNDNNELFSLLAILSERGQWENFLYRVDNLGDSPDGGSVIYYDLNCNHTADSRRLLNPEGDPIEDSIFYKGSWIKVNPMQIPSRTAIRIQDDNELFYFFRDEKWTLIADD